MKFTLLLCVSIYFCLAAIAQHHHPLPSQDTIPQNKKRAVEPLADSMVMEEMNNHGMFASHAYSLNLPMNRNGSGTAWLPDTSPMYMFMIGNEKSNWMFHGDFFLRYNNQDVANQSSRGGAKFDATSMLMAMYNRRIGVNGLLNATAMISADPLTLGGSGYPLLFQTGETYNGKKLVDRQHPHDFISALSLGYTHAFNQNIDLTGYIGYPGEPALGPVAFMHRPSAMNNPNAPL